MLDSPNDVIGHLITSPCTDLRSVLMLCCYEYILPFPTLFKDYIIAAWRGIVETSCQVECFSISHSPQLSLWHPPDPLAPLCCFRHTVSFLLMALHFLGTLCLRFCLDLGYTFYIFLARLWPYTLTMLRFWYTFCTLLIDIFPRLWLYVRLDAGHKKKILTVRKST